MLQDLRCSLLAQIHAAPTEVLEELKVRLQLKDRLFQEVLADRTRHAQQHQQEVQSLMMTISSRDQYIQVELWKWTEGGVDVEKITRCLCRTVGDDWGR